MTSKWLKGIAAALAICVSLGIAGCSANTEESSSESSSSDTEDSVYVKIGYIFHEKVENGGFSSQMNDQRLKAARRCDVETVYIDNVSVQDFESAVKALISAGCNQIISCSSTFTNALSAISSRYMNVNFINYGSYTMGTANMYNYTETAYQGTYVAGIAAAYNSNSKKVGIVADPEMLDIYPTINAAAMGIRFVFENGTLCVAGATKNNEIQQAVDALANEGCDVIISYTESPYTAEYCESRGIKFISNLNYSGKTDNFKNMLMYFYCNRDSFFVSQFKKMKMDSWAQDNYTGSMSNGVITISEALNDAKDNKTQDILDELVPRITSGKAVVFSGEIRDINGNVRYMQTETMTESQIYQMNWYVEGVKVTGNFRVPSQSEPNTFEVKS